MIHNNAEDEDDHYDNFDRKQGRRLQSNEETTYWDIFKEISAISFPHTVTMVMNVSLYIINMFFVGHTNNISRIQGVGLGNIILFIVGNSTMLGMNQTMGPLVSIAKGADSLEACGIYRAAARKNLVFTWILTIPILLMSYKLLDWMNTGLVESEGEIEDDRDLVNEYAYRYILWQIPAMVILGMLNVT